MSKGMKGFLASLAIVLCVAGGTVALVYYSVGGRFVGPRLYCGDTVFIDNREVVLECR